MFMVLQLTEEMEDYKPGKRSQSPWELCGSLSLRWLDG